MTRTLFAGLSALLLAACGQADLYSGLSERHANEMIVALSEAGVEARKSPGAEESWSVTAPAGDFTYAMQVLTAADLPRAEHEDVGVVFKKKGLVSPEVETQARYVYAIEQKLNATLSSIDGVQVARVHIVSPRKDPIARTTTPASASVFLKHDLRTELSSEVATIKTMVANAVDDLSYDDVSVALFPAKPMPVRAEPPAEAAAARMALPVLGALSVAAIAVGGVGMMRRGGKPAPTRAAITDGSADA